MIVISENKVSGEEWDKFVQQHPESRYSQLSNYSYVAESYKYTPKNICFLKDGEIVAVLPAVYTRSLFFGRKLVSQPFSEYGGLLLARKLQNSEMTEIVDLLSNYLSENRIPLIEMHGCHGVFSELRARNFIKKNPHNYAYIELNKPLDIVWKKVISYQARKAVNKAIKSGVVVENNCNEELVINTFFPLYLKSMKRLGVPPHPLEYYLRSYHVFRENMRIFWALKDGNVLAGLLGFTCGKRVNIINIVSDPSYWAYRPNDLLHWEFIKWAHEHGYRYFDFGTIRYEGQMHFKKKWGCTIKDYGHYFLFPENSTSGMSTFNSSSNTMKSFSHIWAKYIPMPISNIIGPIIRKHLVR